MPSIQECIDRVNASPGLACDECHQSTRVVSQALSGLEMGQCDSGTFATWTAELQRAATARESRVYRVDVDQFGHSFAVAQSASKIVVMQSWVGSYTLQEWMLGTDGALKANPYLPRKGEAEYTVLTTYLDITSQDLQARKTENVFKYALALFNPIGVRAQTMKMRIQVAAGNALDLKWSGRAIVWNG